jgi:multiple antibiotic resistance protein
MGLLEYSLLALTSLFVIIDPLAVVPAFLGMTPYDTTADRVRMARLASFVAGGVLIFFVIVGEGLFKILGITMSAFKIAGSIVLLLIAIDMLRAQRSAVVETSEEKAAGAQKEDIAITPLAIPMLSGPGAISTVVLLQNEAKGFDQSVALVCCIGVVCLATYWILRLAAVHGARFFTPIAMKLTTRIMGLLLAALAVQFILDGIAEQKERLFLAPKAAAGLAFANDDQVLAWQVRDRFFPFEAGRERFLPDLGFGHFVNRLDGDFEILGAVLDERDAPARL